MAIFSSTLSDIVSMLSPPMSTKTSSAMNTKTSDCCVNPSTSKTLPLRINKVQYASADPMLATPPSEVKPKAKLATTQPATQDATMQVPSGDSGAEKIVLAMRGGIDHDHHGTRVSHDICCCLICCDCMDDCCTAFDDVICCE